MDPWFDFICIISLAGLFFAAAGCLYRIIVGPGAADRAISFDTLALNLVGILCILCIQWRSTLYFDAVWILMLVGFLGSAAIARYLERGRVF